MYLIPMSYYNIFSLARAKWSDFDTEAKKLGRETNKSIKANGECFLTSLQLAFKHDYGQRYMFDYLKEEIFEEIKCDFEILSFVHYQFSTRHALFNAFVSEISQIYA